MTWKSKFPLVVVFKVLAVATFISSTIVARAQTEDVELATSKPIFTKFFYSKISEPDIAESMPAFWASPIQPTNLPSLQSTVRFQWKSAIRESLFFLAIEHGHRFAEERDTRHNLRGPFFQDWVDSVGNLRGWADGDEFYVNYIGHPMQGAVTGFIQIQNDPQGRGQVLHMGKEYWKSRSKAMLWATLYSIQFEIGPISESSLGNVGLKPTPKSAHPQAYVDLVITPTLGMAWLVGEDALDRYVVSRFERDTDNRIARLLLRSFANPCRSFANMMRMKYPWYRDSRNAGVTW